MSRFNENNEAPLCGCGCGEKTKWCPQKKRYNRFIKWHHTRGENNPMKRPEVAKRHSESLKALGDAHPWRSSKYRKAQSEWMSGDRDPAKRPEVGKKISEAKVAMGENHPSKKPEAIARMKGDANPMKNPETVKKQSKSLKALGSNHPSKRPELRKQNSERVSGKNHPMFGVKRSKEFCEAQSGYMLNGGAAHANSFVKNPSKPQVELYELVKLFYPDAIFNYSSLNKSIDIAIPGKMIAIEYDSSYWHQDKEADDRRQKELEAFGWKFLRYQDRIPLVDELEKIYSK